MLPIGTVVLLKDAIHRLMITGFSAVSYAEKTKVYDYWGCFYPEGQIESDQHFVFNNSNISKVIHEGYSDDEEKKFRKEVEVLIDKIRDENGIMKVTPEELNKIIANGGK